LWPPHRWCAQVIIGQRQRRRVGGLQIRAQSVKQSALITGGAFVVAGDRAGEQCFNQGTCRVSSTTLICRGVGLQSQTALDQPLYSGLAVLDPELFSHPFRYRSQDDVIVSCHAHGTT
jgi:hypothetical protein